MTEILGQPRIQTEENEENEDSVLMIELIDQHQNALAELCVQFGVERMYLFGSAADGRFSPEVSDLDFLVEMQDRRPTGSYADRYLGLAEALERLFSRRVDLVTEQAIRNPYFRQQVELTRRLVYEQPHQEVAV